MCEVSTGDPEALGQGGILMRFGEWCFENLIVEVDGGGWQPR